MSFIGCVFAPPAVVYKHPEFIKNKNKVYRIAVLPFKDAKGSPDSGKTIADIFETTLLTSGKFEVFERMQLEKVLNEQNLNLSGLIENPISIGKMVKVDLVVIGSVTTWHQGGWLDTATIVGASVKAVNVETGLTFWSIDDSVSGREAGINDGGVYTAPDILARILCRKMIKNFMDGN